MLNWFGPTLLMTCSPTRFTVQRRTRFGRDCDAPVIYDLIASQAQLGAQRCLSAQGINVLLDQFSIALSKLAPNGATIDIVVDDAWCRLFMTTPPSNPATRADLTAAVALRFQNLYGDSTADWVLQADQQVSKPFVCAALPQAMQQGFVDIADKSRSRITRLVPAYVDAWSLIRRSVGPSDWFAQIGEAQITLAIFNDVRLRYLMQLPLDPFATRQSTWLMQLMQREALRLNLPSPKRIICTGSVPAAWIIANDAGQPCQVVTAQKRTSHEQNSDTAAAVPAGPSR